MLFNLSGKLVISWPKLKRSDQFSFKCLNRIIAEILSQIRGMTWDWYRNSGNCDWTLFFCFNIFFMKLWSLPYCYRKTYTSNDTISLVLNFKSVLCYSSIRLGKITSYKVILTSVLKVHWWEPPQELSITVSKFRKKNHKNYNSPCNLTLLNTIVFSITTKHKQDNIRIAKNSNRQNVFKSKQLPLTAYCNYNILYDHANFSFVFITKFLLIERNKYFLLIRYTEMARLLLMLVS